MKLSHVLVGSALLACATVAQAAPITVVNGSFEDCTLQQLATVAGDTWNHLASVGSAWGSPAEGGDYGVYGTNGVAGTGVHLLSAATGTHLFNTGYPLSQTLSYTVAAGDTFTLDFYVAKDLDGTIGTGTLTASILVGGTSIATDATVASTAALGAWDHKTLTGAATGTGALSISFAPGASSPWLDNVTMSVISVPEPASLSLLSLSGLALLRRRRA